MSTMGQQAMLGQFQTSRRMICGVCAWISMRTGAPVWAVRVLAILILLSHAPLAVLAYLGTALWLKSRATDGGFRGMASSLQPPRWPGPAPASGSAAGPTWEHGALMDRFSRLDRRLARMEEEAMGSEFQLRRRFRDLEK
jgi:phage shock protein PspC (stress-responsive transcriptional regulator)